MLNGSYLDPFIETLGREALWQIQLKRLQLNLDPILSDNSFYRRKFAEAGVKTASDVGNLETFRQLPFTTKSELSADQAGTPPYGTDLTYSRDKFTHIHQTSGTTGQPLRWLDTDESWEWWGRCWASVYKAAGVTVRDRIFFAFSFGPFIGFWSAYHGAQHIGALAVPGGGMSSYQRVKAILDHDITVLVCTPTYALHLAEVAEQEQFDIAQCNVSITIHAGEPGASVPATKSRIENSWGARCYDHAGATEIGAWGFECQTQSGLHVNEGEFICEIIDPATGAPADDGELVLTNLGRMGSPIIRYRTGDHARRDPDPCECGRTFLKLSGGLIGRIDDAAVVRGINVFPSAIENIVLRFPEVSEYKVDIYRRKQLDDMEVTIEVRNTEPQELARTVGKEIRNSLGLRVEVTPVQFGTLPRSELKAKRFTDHRKDTSEG